MIYVTRDLLTVLLDRAAERDPTAVNLQLSATPASEFDAELGLDPETPVVTHFTLADVGGSVNAVFGVDLGTPAGQGRARFVSHPNGRLEATREDTFAAALVVAVPPWDESSCAVFNRNNRRLELNVLDAEPPQESLAGDDT